MRPYPHFPNNRALWRDGANYTRGHWINGRVSARTLASVVDEICARAGLVHFDVEGLYGLVRGYMIEQVSEARAGLQPLALRYGFDAVDRDGLLRFAMRDGLGATPIDLETLVRDSEREGVLEETRGSVIDLAGRVRLRFVEADGDFEIISEEAILPDDRTHAVSSSEMPLAMTRAAGRQTVERWLSEARVATDTVQFTLPPSRLETGAGDVIALPEDGGAGLFRIDRVGQMAGSQKVEAVRIEPESYRPAEFTDEPAALRAFTPPVPVTPFFLDLPVMTGDEVPHAPHIAVTASPWPGSAALYSADQDANYALNRLINGRTPVGITETPLLPAPSGRYDLGADLQVRMLNGQLESISRVAMLNGANLCAIGDGTPGGWELIQFREAELIDAETYLLRLRLRGQLGTERTEPWPAGSYLVRLDGSAGQIDLPESKRGLARHYRIGPGGRPVDDPSYAHAVIAFEGNGLRPLSPVHLRLDGAAGQDRKLSWIRRTRIDGDRWEAPEVPLGEEAESYVVRVIKDDVVLREALTTSPAWTYSAAAQSADGIAAPYELQVAQVSARFGAGVFARLEVA